jgi:hypothetical protein
MKRLENEDGFNNDRLDYVRAKKFCIKSELSFNPDTDHGQC